MPRRGNIERRPIPPDARYNSVLVQKFINKVMERGKKSLAERIVYQALDLAAERLKKPQMEIFEQALRNASPSIEVRPKRVGGATYQVPVEVKSDRRYSLAMRWLLMSARARTGKPMVERLAAELIDAYNNTGTTIKRKEDVHRMAEANRAFAHYGRL
ncbi:MULTISPECIES: 30S ribosomal protein S7 [Chloroflexus]|jgi:small subunit ribosomal protein S7|uniref:Small ribosomal subunit protein uS7 n=2 Tax=Chloroflexus aurantiacus TaxID=1108 RepID=RS7_CHLAA|nr:MULTISPECIES: 30S ribosomal protein S7 [Chloroflexus]A9WH61.1 RecName: Full=Small ribosomal subunit protein uS7; AltName: Full=30S ribosomal protein S7 [Chloroflexus aurantiacus J-10-fl]B9LJC7.1 RecName: Full=Small ribosomal subunit protein uS7; AltName: Full=30S ribosomal protein S7 [Chloroflexus aurantiacus Y-400-fl]RMG53167.1 MAG: 30S ribosomal protein S7 [Chloroflexota bacterium]ABY35573.1 ribosomal protein S7 [Chloroflexus aurantiacus J-10-fl]GIV91974.1 MAG: 30S ribosomal protein S7 [C